MGLFRSLPSLWAAWALLALGGPSPARADDAPGIRLGEPVVSTWRFGVSVRAAGGPVTGILATLPVPMDWPEQTVRVLQEEKSRPVRSMSYRTLEGGVKQLLVAIPRLPAGEEATAAVTFEIHKRPILAPIDTRVYQAPARTSRETASFLLPSPYIESRAPEIVARAKALSDPQAGGWDRVAALFDWVRANVRYEFAEQIKPATAALADGQGDCEELSSLVIALCRANKIPARAVWVPGHTYPEFYLVDEQGRGHWFPCQAAGAEREFGSLREDRPILQKGDNFQVPEERGPQRYVKQLLTAKNAPAPPEVRFILERLTPPAAADGPPTTAR